MRNEKTYPEYFTTNGLFVPVITFVVLSPPPPIIFQLFHLSYLHRGTIGAGEIVEAISDPKRAATFATRLGDLIKENPATDERVREENINRQPATVCRVEAVLAYAPPWFCRQMLMLR